MTLIDKKYGSDSEAPRINDAQLLNALKASNRIDSHLATNMAKLNKNFSEHKRAMGDSHQQVEDVIVDQATRVMNHSTEESKRQNKEALEEYFKTPNFFVDLLIIIWLVKSLNLNSKSQEQRILAIEISLLFFCFWFFEPLFSFFIYFCFLHSTRHLIEEKNNLQLKTSKLILKTIPMTLLTLLFFTLIFFFFYDSVNTLALSYVVIGLSSLTISHIVLINFTKNN